jgi:hypothetical protein
MLNIIGISTQPLSIHRLGKPSSKPRPIRIVMPSPPDVFQILKVKLQLFNVDKFKTVRVSSDQTLQQRKLYSSVVSELKFWRDAGETDLFIKYVNNCPTISKNDQQAQNLYVNFPSTIRTFEVLILNLICLLVMFLVAIMILLYLRKPGYLTM